MQLERARGLLAGGGDRATLQIAIGALREAMYSETGTESDLLDALFLGGRDELHIVWVTMLALPAAVVIGVIVLRRRVLRPLDDLTALLQPISRGEFRPLALSDVDPMLVPLFTNFNDMVTRLADLEGEHRKRAATLESEVRSATEALLRQQDEFARAQRFAAVGQLSANVAHELRNPLAGIAMTLANLRRETTDPSTVERLDLVIGEVQRIGRLLSDLLLSSRSASETPTVFALATLVDELLGLTRYRTPPAIALVADIPRELRCRLPRDGLRQALLNLVLNAIEAIGPSPGRVELFARAESGDLVLEVRDDGPGFPDELLERGIRPNWSARGGGTGLGLEIVDRFVRDNGGRLALSNRSPHGACALVRVPEVCSNA